MKLVTGASGFLGKVLIKKLLEKGEKVRAMARNEENLHKIEHVEYFQGDVNDRYSIKEALRGVDGVFHLAAFKYVGAAEKNSRLCINTNVNGSIILCEEALDKVNFVIATSTDKAARISGVYGASKFLMEAVFNQFDNMGNTRYRIIRYGNVLYSTGSVLCIWKDRIKKNLPIEITDREATRFYWSVDQAVDSIFDCLEHAKSAKPWVNGMKAVRMGTMLEMMLDKYGRVPVKETGLKKGENLHERLYEGVTSDKASKWDESDLYELL